MLPGDGQLSAAIIAGTEMSYHARAGEHVPTEPDSIPVLYLTPLLLHCLVVGHTGCLVRISRRGRPQLELTRKRKRGVRIWGGEGAKEAKDEATLVKYQTQQSVKLVTLQVVVVEAHIIEPWMRPVGGFQGY